ncbi:MULTISPECIES: lipoprotein [unclassified Modicisalibacter]|uniref:LPS translocon maturation chaperone LptM n=1 Tax=unclassified Modicisalibacter TaxID=2679913 RepID=UPI001CCF2376|nr:MULTISPECIES: lipoprotein [unclassified Modicisalibacter]MBZ9558874.1 lipoprotein [Modicisalibacter sp. R2A 31.J]MBZ9575234.1 lipoprotein [Modicisalibacter sp. MOD 31.J]
MSRTIHRRVPALLVLGLLVGTGLGGCGQKGPLYHPGDEQAAEAYDPAGAYDDDRAAGDDPQPSSESADDGRPDAGGTE